MAAVREPPRPRGYPRCGSAPSAASSLTVPLPLTPGSWEGGWDPLPPGRAADTPRARRGSKSFTRSRPGQWGARPAIGAGDSPSRDGGGQGQGAGPAPGHAPPQPPTRIHYTPEMDYDQVHGSSHGKKLYSEMWR